MGRGADANLARLTSSTRITSTVAETWEDHVGALYLSTDMEVDEFEALLDVAMRGERPDHPELPAYLKLENGMWTTRERR